MLPQKHSPSNHDESIRDRMTQMRIFKEKKKKKGWGHGGGVLEFPAKSLLCNPGSTGPD